MGKLIRVNNWFFLHVQLYIFAFPLIGLSYNYYELKYCLPTLAQCSVIYKIVKNEQCSTETPATLHEQLILQG